MICLFFVPVWSVCWSKNIHAKYIMIHLQSFVLIFWFIHWISFFDHQNLFVLVQYLFFEDCLTQYNPFCTPIISSNRITRAHYDNMIIKNGRFSQRRKYFFWCKCHDEFIITTLLYPYFIFKAVFITCSHSFLYRLVLICTRTDIMNSDLIFFFNVICHKKESKTKYEKNLMIEKWDSMNKSKN